MLLPAAAAAAADCYHGQSRQFFTILTLLAFISLLQTAVVGMVVSTTFIQYPTVNMTDANYFMSVCFFSLMFM